MNISKIKLACKFITGGREGILDYALDDLKVTPDELTAVCNSFRIAYAAWRAE